MIDLSIISYPTFGSGRRNTWKREEWIRRYVRLLLTALEDKLNPQAALCSNCASVKSVSPVYREACRRWLRVLRMRVLRAWHIGSCCVAREIHLNVGLLAHSLNMNHLILDKILKKALNDWQLQSLLIYFPVYKQGLNDTLIYTTYASDLQGDISAKILYRPSYCSYLWMNFDGFIFIWQHSFS